MWKAGIWAGGCADVVVTIDLGVQTQVDFDVIFHDFNNNIASCKLCHVGNLAYMLKRIRF